MAEYLIQDSTLTEIANAIRAKTGGTDPIPVPNMAEQIAGITTGGGSSEDVRYVTFLSYDGLVEYGKKAVAVGDDCADPIARGVFDTPTRESTAQYSYTFAGWATEANGGLDASWNKAVSEDRAVYANFAAVVRYYTVTYYDSDGTTVLKTAQVAYGDTPVAYTPEKEGYSFSGWEPEVAAVTGDAGYTAVWMEKVTFAGGSWTAINTICEAGTAADYFAVGDTREFASADGTETYVLRIIGIGVDTKANGSGKAGITVALTKAGNVAFGPTTWTTINWNEEDLTKWSRTQTVKTYLTTTVYNALPAALRSIIKSVSKTTVREYNDSGYLTDSVNTTDTLFLPSLTEMNVDDGVELTEPGFYYPGLDTAAERKPYDNDGAVADWWTRTGYGANQVCHSYKGSVGTGIRGNLGSEKYVIPCFCI